MSDLEAAFLQCWHLLAPDAPEPEQQSSPCVPGRRFRADFAWPETGVIVECQGGEWLRGRHTRGGGFTQDCERHNLIVARGWRVFYVTAKMLDTDPQKWIAMIENAVRWGYRAVPNAPDEVDTPATIEDGFGSRWSAWCAMCGRKSMQVVRPGKVQCEFCG